MLRGIYFVGDFQDLVRCQPFDLGELTARIETVLRRYHKTERELEVGRIRIDTLSRTVFSDGEPVFLPAKEYELLRILLSNSSRVVPRDELLGEIWGFDFVGETRTLDMHIKTLRAKLHDDVENPRYIKTIRSVGYKFIG